MMFEQVTLIHPSFRDHTSHAVCPSISTCMCDAIQLGNLLSAGRALPAMADDKKPTQPWKRSVAPVVVPDWMTASVVRLEEAREETLDSARKRQRETPLEEDEEMPPVGAYVAAASSASGEPTASGSVSEPPSVAEDMRNFRFASMTPAAFYPTRHLFMCAGRPMVVACLMYSPTPSLSHAKSLRCSQGSATA